MARPRAGVIAAGRRCQLRSVRGSSGARSRISSPRRWCAPVLRLDASDVWYALPDDGAAASAMAVGRLAGTPNSSRRWWRRLWKTGWGPARPGAHDALLVADNDEPGFAEAAKAFGDQLTAIRCRRPRWLPTAQARARSWRKRSPRGPGCWGILATAAWSCGRRRRSWRWMTCRS